MDFETAFARLVDPSHEGGYVNDPQDLGGETKYGISKRTYPGEDIANLTLDRAKELYRRDYWGPSGGDALPDLLKFEMFDLAVNTSAPGRPVTAIEMLQKAVGADVDGILGPATLQAAGNIDSRKALSRLQSLRLKYYTSRPPEWKERFLSGVVNRVADNMWSA